MEFSEIIARQRAYFRSGKTIPCEERLRALTRLYETIEAMQDELCDALKADLGKSAAEAYMCEIGIALSEISDLRRHLKKWMKPKRVSTGLANFRSFGTVEREPHGCVLIMSPWNYPVQLTLVPLAGAVAGGNCAVVKPSAYAPETSKVLARLIRAVFTEEHVAVVEGGRAENAALLEERFDYIFFTGSVRVGRLVMEKAAHHLTPVTLELGGKSPCIIDATADIRLAATRIAFGKCLNLGQTCVAPDYVLIDASVKDDFIRYYKKAVKSMYGKAPMKSRDYGKMINEKHFDRVRGLIDPAKVVFGGEADRTSLKIEPTLMDGVTPEDAIMQEEIFGPVLPILTVNGVDEAFDFVRDREKPLAAYLFTKDRETERRYRKELSFGGGCVNDTIVHLATSNLPFGGVGNSGMGGYHGRYSFETFTHGKSVLKKAKFPDLTMRYAPYRGWKNRLIRMFLK